MSKNITSYDLLKTFAVIFMVVDHIGMYFFPDDLWWRAAGRACVPVWFFLVGYARGRDLSPKILIGAALLLVANFLAGMPIFPLNVLVTIILIRLILNPLMTTTLSVTGREFWPMAMLLFLLAIPTMLITEYGPQALILSSDIWCGIGSRWVMKNSSSAIWRFPLAVLSRCRLWPLILQMRTSAL